MKTAVAAADQRALDIESAAAIVTNATVLAVNRGTSRMIARKCDHPLEACLLMDKAARYTIDRGAGREIGRDEALAILKECENHGLVRMPMNKAHPGHFICNCPRS